MKGGGNVTVRLIYGADEPAYKASCDLLPTPLILRSGTRQSLLQSDFLLHISCFLL